MIWILNDTAISFGSYWRRLGPVCSLLLGCEFLKGKPLTRLCVSRMIDPGAEKGLGNHAMQGLGATPTPAERKAEARGSQAITGQRGTLGNLGCWFFSAIPDRKRHPAPHPQIRPSTEFVSQRNNVEKPEEKFNRKESGVVSGKSVSRQTFCE